FLVHAIVDCDLHSFPTRRSSDLQRTRNVCIICPGQALAVFDLVEELVGEAQRVDDTNGVAHAANKSIRIASHFAASCFIESYCFIQLFWRADSVGESCDGSDISLAQDEVMVDEFLKSAQVDCFIIFMGDHEA